jgi:hypothetical protein
MLAVQLAAFLALLLLASGLHKLIRRRRTETVVHAFAGVPRAAAPLAAVAAGAAESAAGVMLWVPAWRAAGGLLAVLIWGGYLALIAHAIRQGRRDVDCGCTFGSAQHPLGFYQLARNALLIGAALLVSGVALPDVTPPVPASQVLAACALLALYGALDQSMALTPPRAGVAS